ncbi:glycosyltransferase family 4 protein [Yeosuana sp. AK3]
MNKKRALFILHYSPPIHGACKVGDSIINSTLINTNLESKYVKIKGTNNLDDTGKFNFNKIKHSIELLLNIIIKLFIFKPDIIYFTTSPQGFAFYRDFLISLPIKIFCLFKKCNVYYHYHARGIQEFTLKSATLKGLTNLFLKNVNIIFISEQMKSEVDGFSSYKKVHFLNNGVDDNLDENTFADVISKKSNNIEINILYLSNMIKEKGYDTVLNLAKQLKAQSNKTVKFHFAGGWFSYKDKVFFNNYIKENKLENIIEYHGLVQGKEKDNLLKKANFFVFLSRYKKEVFPLSVLEALSYGLPVLAFNAGAVSDIIKQETGIISSIDNLMQDFEVMINNYLNNTVYIECRNTYLKKYTTQKFEENLLKILKA